MNSLKSQIKDLIDLQQEGDYWDFKKEHHKCNALLLHDILCMSNSLSENDRYIIFGVSDPNSNCEIIGLADSQIRKQQSNIIDFLSKIEFAGHVRPKVKLDTINLEGKEIDILTILDLKEKPYYLSEDYPCKNKICNCKKTIKANYIYTRVGDRNTPISASADLKDIEKMWQERFGLNLAPIDKMKEFLKRPAEWFKDIDRKRYAYHKQSPEYNIEFSEGREGKEMYSFFYTNPVSSFVNAKFKYHTTILFELTFCLVDEARLSIGEPSYCPCNFGQSNLNERPTYYLYYNLSKKNGIFHQWLTDGDLERSARGEHCQFLFFKDQNEHEIFHQHLINNKEELLNLEYWYPHKEEEIIEKHGFNINFDFGFFGKCRKFWEMNSGKKS